MKRLSLKVVIVFVAGIFIAGCSNNGLYHNYLMRGQVVEIKDDKTVVCIGKYDGAQVGQELKVMRFTPKIAPAEGEDSYIVSTIGKVKVVEIINDHFARVSLVSGEIRTHDMVEL